MNETMVERAIAFAHDAHFEQYRKVKYEPYINHPKRVAEKLTTEEERTVAWLHDVLEDTGVSVDDLKRTGFSEHTIMCVKILTRDKGETYFDYIRRIIVNDNLLVFRVKLVDLEDNMHDLTEGSLKDKYRFAKHMILSKMDAGGVHSG